MEIYARKLRGWSLILAVFFAVGCAGDEPTGEATEDHPQLELVDTSQLEWSQRIGETSSSLFEVNNTGDADLEFEFVERPDWLTLTPTEGQIGPGESKEIEAEATCPDTPGQYTQPFVVQSNDPHAESVDVVASLSCEEAATGELQVVVEGLEETILDAAITVEGPEEFSESVVETKTFEEVALGEYTVTAEPVGTNAIYEPTPAETTVEVTRGAQQQVDVSYEVIPGSLEVTVEGLPDGVEHDIDLVDQNDDAVPLPQNGLVEELDPGDYTVSPNDVETGGELYEASVVDVTVISDQTSEAKVEYILDPGYLEVTVEGLPDGVDHDIEVIDEADETTAVPQSGELTLEPGSYEVVANDVTDGPTTWEADGTTVDINSGDTEQIDVVYSVIPAALTVDVVGDLGALAADIEVTGPDGFSEQLAGGDSWTDLTPGDYSVTASDVVDSPATYEASGSIQDLTLESGADETVEITYGLLLGEIAVEVEEFGDPSAYELVITGPEGFSETITEATGAAFPDQLPGDYTVSVQQVPEDADGNVGYVVANPDTFTLESSAQQIVGIEVADGTTVTTSLDDGPGSLRSVLGSVVSESTVGFAEGISQVTVSDGDISIQEKIVTIQGHSEENPVEITADESRMFLVEGTSDNDGILILEDLVVSGGSDTRGGAVRVEATAGLVSSRVVFEDNTASEQGGAIYLGTAGSALLWETILRNNSAGNAGGALATVNPGVNIVETAWSLFENNSADSSGGAIYFQSDSASSDGELDVRHTTFSGNTATDYGGAVRVVEDIATFDGVTITDNTADLSGGGISASTDAEPSLRGTIVAANTGDDFGGAEASFTSRGYNVVTQSWGDFAGETNGDQVVTDAGLEAPADNGGFSNTAALTDTSPARAIIPIGVCLYESMGGSGEWVVDQRLERRPAGANCSAGAYEPGHTLETFDADGVGDISANVYQTGSFVGEDGIEWNYQEARRTEEEEGGYYVEGTGLILHPDRTNDSKIYAENVDGDLESMSVWLSQAFTSGGTRMVEVYVDGELVGTSPDVEAGGEAPYPIELYGIDDIDATGGYDIEIRAAGEMQIVVDNISLY